MVRNYYLDSSMIPECEKSFRKAIVGGIYVILGMAIMYFGSDFHFGYLKSNALLSLIGIFAFVSYGAILISSYIRCIVNYNERL